jgi:hypothetical protein
MRGLLLGHGRRARKSDGGGQGRSGSRGASSKGQVDWPWAAVDGVSLAPGTLDGYAEIWRCCHGERWWGFVGSFLAAIATVTVGDVR